MIHPYFKEYPELIFVDGLLHGIVEQNPSTTVKKFIKYNLPKILGTISKKAKKNNLCKRHQNK